MNQKSTVKRNPDLISTEIDGDLVLLHPDTGEYYGVKQVGNEIWGLIDSSCRVEDIVEELVKRYDAPKDTILADILTFLNDMSEEGLIIVEDD